ncbi:hypothetical protein BKA69DRAFT_1063784 [Paraphysoderma sedebokerense]|nr:hypothetical protein BKA69DRAFT_1063784 [Paraphysoderma sedebokerense]
MSSDSASQFDVPSTRSDGSPSWASSISPGPQITSSVIICPSPQSPSFSVMNTPSSPPRSPSTEDSVNSTPRAPLSPSRDVQPSPNFPLRSWSATNPWIRRLSTVITYLTNYFFWPFVGGIMYGFGEVCAREYVSRRLGGLTFERRGLRGRNQGVSDAHRSNTINSDSLDNISNITNSESQLRAAERSPSVVTPVAASIIEDGLMWFDSSPQNPGTVASDSRLHAELEQRTIKMETLHGSWEIQI